MGAVRVPDALAERLGTAASAELIELLDDNNHIYAKHVMDQSSERFERRLIEETSKIRVEMAQMRGDLRQEMHAGFGTLRQEMATSRFELLKWAFVFWVGQLVSIVGIVALLLSRISPR